MPVSAEALKFLSLKVVILGMFFSGVAALHRTQQGPTISEISFLDRLAKDFVSLAFMLQKHG